MGQFYFAISGSILFFISHANTFAARAIYISGWTTTYGYNNMGFEDGDRSSLSRWTINGVRQGSGQRYSRLKYPSRQLVLADVAYWGGDGYTREGHYRLYAYIFLSPRHSGLVNVLYADWHVEPTPILYLWQADWHGTPWWCNNPYTKWTNDPWPYWMPKW